MSDYKEDPAAAVEPELENPDRKVVKRAFLLSRTRMRSLLTRFSIDSEMVPVDVLQRRHSRPV